MAVDSMLLQPVTLSMNPAIIRYVATVVFMALPSS
jgi:hypothetical protein